MLSTSSIFATSKPWNMIIRRCKSVPAVMELPFAKHSGAIEGILQMCEMSIFSSPPYRQILEGFAAFAGALGFVGATADHLLFAAAFALFYKFAYKVQYFLQHAEI